MGAFRLEIERFQTKGLEFAQVQTHGNGARAYIALLLPV